VRGALLVQEAGGVVTDLAGRDVAYNRADPYVHGILAGSAGAHAALLALAVHCRQAAGWPRAGTGRKRRIECCSTWDCCWRSRPGST